MKLTDKLDQLMEERGLNKADVAKGAGLPYMTVANLWNHGAENIKLSTLRKLASFFNVTLDDLVYGNDVREDDNDIETIAAHREGDEEWTEEELRLIEEFKEFVRSQRKQRKE